MIGPTQPSLGPVDRSVVDTVVETRTHTPVLSNATRFVGDLNPEASLLEHQNVPSRDRSGIGTWLDIECGSNLTNEDARNRLKNGHVVDHRRSAGLDSVDHDQPLDYQPILPDRVDQSALLEIFFSRVYPLLPVIDKEPFEQEFSTGDASPIVMQAICLVAGKDSDARPHLHLPGARYVLDSRQFTRRLYHDLVYALTSRRQDDRIHLIQALALISLHVEGSDGTEEASMHLAQAIHHAQTIGLHLGRSHGDQRYRDRLFWSLRCLDVLNAATNGRPQIINHRDVGLHIEDVLDSCSPSFQVVLALTRLLARVIALYQPTSNPDAIGIEEDFPGFETIVDQCTGWKTESRILSKCQGTKMYSSLIDFTQRLSNCIIMALQYSRTGRRTSKATR